MKMNRPVIEINYEVCVGCGLCAKVCPTGAISLIFERATVNPLACTGCGHCLEVCQPGAIGWREVEAPGKIPERPVLGSLRPGRGRPLPRQHLFGRKGCAIGDINELRRRLHDLKEKADDIVKRIDSL